MTQLGQVTYTSQLGTGQVCTASSFSDTTVLRTVADCTVDPQEVSHVEVKIDGKLDSLLHEITQSNGPCPANVAHSYDEIVDDWWLPT